MLEASKKPATPPQPASTAEAELKELERALTQRRPQADLAEYLRDGIVFWRELDLDAPLKLVDHLLDDDERHALVANTIDRTKQLGRVLDLLCKLSVRDPLTGLFNRRHFDHRLLQELSRARRDGRPCSLMLIDLDDFKAINDTQGHDSGDQVLRCVADVLRASLRTTDEIARIGGDEFAVVLPNTDFYNAKSIVGPRLVDKMVACTRPRRDQLAPRVSVSIGLTTFHASNPLTPIELFKLADEALYQAKAAGKNTVRGIAAAPEETGLTADEREALF